MKKKFIFCVIAFVIILVFIFMIYEYKRPESGNNINNTDILNISSYEASVTVEVHSNKNINKYIINQRYEKPNYFSQEIVEPSNIRGLTVIYNGENVIVENRLLGLKQLYENFNGSISNLSLIGFINEYKENSESKSYENESEIIMETKLSNSQNKYQMYQRLYISKKSNLPTKMEILDNNKNVTVYILYNEIRIN